jgi:hypothetical protein
MFERRGRGIALATGPPAGGNDMTTVWNKVMDSGRWIAALVLAGAVASGCATPIEPATGTETSAVGSCCFDGAFLCPTNPDIEFDYGVPGCGELGKTRAQSLCNTQCGHACTDTGWQPSGLCN